MVGFDRCLGSDTDASIWRRRIADRGGAHSVRTFFAAIIGAFSTVTLLLTAPAFGQNDPAWTRIDGDGDVVAYAYGTSDTRLTFSCAYDEEAGVQRGTMSVTVPPGVNVGSGAYGVIFNVDGGTPEQMINTRRRGDSEEGVILTDTTNFGHDGEYRLNTLAEAVALGSTLEVDIPKLSHRSHFSLKGSSRALEGIYGECGTRPTGTGIME